MDLPDWPVDQDVYTGFWINRAQGPFRGATITLNQQVGGFAIAFVALFVGATARSCWTLTRFALHTSYATSTGQDGVYHQRQAILRNTSLAYDAAFQALRLSIVWRHRAQHAWTRVLSVLFAAITISAASIAAGIFSSKLLTSSTTEVLIAGRQCGVLANDEVPAFYTIVEKGMLYQSQQLTNAFSYSSQCYGDQKSESCGKYAQSMLPYTVDANASCPFAADICKSPSGNLILDSGKISSVHQLGLNGGPPFTLEFTNHCAPLSTKGYTNVTTITDERSNASREYMVYNYGVKDNESYVYAAEVDTDRWSFYGGSGGTYKMSYVLSSYEVTRLIPELMQSHDMVSMVFLDSSEIVYLNQTQDPWFSATTPVDSHSAEDAGYFADTDSGVLGCAMQRIVCNPLLSDEIGCVNLFANNETLVENLKKAWPDPRDQRIIYPLMVAQASGGIDGAPETWYSIPGVPTLLSRNTLLDSVQFAHLPNDRWQVEREHLYKGSLALLQAAVVEYSRGYWYHDDGCSLDFPCERLCHNQRIRSSKFYSFSAWIAFFMLLLGTIIMLLALFIEDVFELFLRKAGLRANTRLTYGHAEWQSGSTLQLQRLAHESAGLGTWKRTNESIPVTEPGDSLGILDTSRPGHARLVRADTEMSRMHGGEIPDAKTGVRYRMLSSDEHI